jgi:hypothetical protein
VNECQGVFKNIKKHIVARIRHEITSKNCREPVNRHHAEFQKKVQPKKRRRRRRKDEEEEITKVLQKHQN